MKKDHFQARLCESLRRYRDRIALEYGDRFISYAELDRRSGEVANRVTSEGIEKETFIGLAFTRRPAFIWTLIGIIKAGCVFVPLDLAHPDGRLAAMVETTGTTFVFTDSGRIASLTPAWGMKNLSKTGDVPAPAGKPARTYDGEDKIYIYFTSGSSGTPKAIVGKNRSLLHFIDWEIDTFGIDETYRFSQFINPGFDAFLRDIFVPLCSGGRVCIPAGDEILLDAAALTRWTGRSAVNAIHCVPGFFRLLNNDNIHSGLFENLKFVFLSGEKINPAGLTNWYDTFGERTRLVNFYGPSETTMIKTYYHIRPEDTKRERIPIGKPMRGARLIILDAKMKMCTGKMVGEIYIRTPFRTFGYFNEPALNEEKFIPNPFNDNPGDKLYATGDIGRLLPDGNYELLGRNDRQVKIRGVRVELEEIENVTARHARVEEAAVIKEEISPFNEQLCLFISTRRRAGEEDEGEVIPVLKEYIKRELPPYMAPARIEQVDGMPRNPNGKIDYKSLYRLLEARKRDVVQPRNSRESSLRDIWAGLLRVEKEHIGITNSFLELGGNSLNAMTLSARIHSEFRVRLSLAELFENDTIAEQAEIIAASTTGTYESVKGVEEKEYYLLSSAQDRLYVLQQMEPDSFAYNTHTFVQLKGEVQKEKLSRAFHGLIERHESLRTSFFVVADKPVQKIHNPGDIDFKIEYYEAGSRGQGALLKNRPQYLVDAVRLFQFPTLTYQKSPQKTFDEGAGAVIDAFIRPFDLAQAPLLRAGLIEIGAEEYILMVDMHHIAADGVSHGILIRDFKVFYEGGELPPLPTRYRDFSEWQNNRKQAETGRLKEQEEFWLLEFSGDIPVLNLPTDYARPVLQSSEGRSLDFTIAGQEKKALNRLALEQEATLYMVLLALFNVLLSKLSGQEDVVVGSPTAGRDHVDLQKIIGMFVNTLTLRNFPFAERTFVDFLKEVKEKSLRVFENQDYPFEDLIEKVAVKRDTGRSPLFDVMFVMQNMGRPAAAAEKARHGTPGEEEAALSHQPYPYERKVARFDLTLAATESAEHILFYFQYCSKLFARETIARFVTYFRNIVSVVAADPYCRLADIEIISEAEKKRVLFDFNGKETAYPTDKTAALLFEDQVGKTPGNIAVIGGTEDRWSSGTAGVVQLSYRTVDDRSGRLAALLIEKKGRQNGIAAIIADRSIEMIIGIIAALKAGWAYLPIEPDYPPERKEYMLRDSHTGIVLTTGRLHREEALPEGLKIETLFIEDVGGAVEKAAGVEEEYRGSPGDMAYLIYTSGSTGKPKGVIIEHSSLINLVFSQKKDFNIDERDRVLLFTSFCFDPSVEQVFITLFSGAALVLIDKDTLMQEDEFARFIPARAITQITAVPSFLSNINLEYHQSIKRIVVGGEISSHLLVEKLSRHCDFYNEYGPTEAAVTSVKLKIKKAHLSLPRLPIGKPIDNVRLYVVDKNMALLPPGIIGELYIGGKGVARGYLNNPELTAKKFVEQVTGAGDRCSPHMCGEERRRAAPRWPEGSFGKVFGPPFFKKVGARAACYKTGDLVKWLEDGNMVFMGRIDQQVKIRGFRIEPGEVENLLLAHPHVQEAAVLPRSYAGEAAETYLCAYILSAPDREPETAVLREYLSLQMPDYMVPAHFIFLNEMPLTPNGKIDREELPAPGLTGGEAYRAPRDPVEKKVAEIFAGVLSLDGPVGIDDDFFESGGHSLKATALVSRLHRELDIKIPLQEVFRTPTVRGLAAYIGTLSRHRFAAVRTAEKREFYGLSSAQKRLFIQQQVDVNTTNYNMNVMAALGQDVDKSRLENTFRQLLDRHETLRTSFVIIDDEPVQKILSREEIAFEIEYFAFPSGEIASGGQGAFLKNRPLDPQKTFHEGLGRISDAFIRPFDLARPPLLRAGIIAAGQGHILIVDMHHIISDKLSQETLVRDFMTLDRGETPEPLRLQYKDYSEWLNSETNREAVKRQEAYWLDRFSGTLPVLNLPTDFPRPAVQTHEGIVLSFIIGRDETLALKKLAAAESATMQMVILAALNILFFLHSGQEDIIIGTPSAGRGHADLQDIIGVFINTMPLRNFPTAAKTYLRFLREVKTNSLAAYENQDYEFEQLVNRIRVERDPGRHVLFDVMFEMRSLEAPARNTAGEEAAKTTGTTAAGEAGGEAEPASAGRTTNKLLFDMDWMGLDVGERLIFTLSYNTRLFERESIVLLIENFRVLLGSIANDVHCKIADLEYRTAVEQEIGEVQDLEFNF